MTKPTLLTGPGIDTEIWARFDSSALAYELFLDEECDTYIGSADTLDEAKQAGRWWCDDQKSCFPRS